MLATELASAKSVNSSDAEVNSSDVKDGLGEKMAKRKTMTIDRFLPGAPLTA